MASGNRAFAAAAALPEQITADVRVIQLPLAQLGEGIKETELVQWFVEEGDRIEEFERLCEVQSDKASVEITSRYTGTVRRLHHAVGAIIQIGEVLVDLEVEGEVEADAAALQQDDVEAATRLPPSSVPPAVLASPAVRRVARELGVELEAVPGSGSGGRVLREDVEAAATRLSAAETPVSTSSSTPAATTAAVGAAPASAGNGEAAPAVTRGSGIDSGDALRGPWTAIPLRGYRRAMVQSMAATLAVPHFHFCDELDLTALTALRAQLQGTPVLGSARLTLLPFVIKAISEALREFPTINARLAPDGAALLQFPHHNVGVAMAVPGGLVVPNMKHVEQRSIADIARELEALATAAAASQLPAEALAGGTITVSNIGTIGGTYATPLVNPPESAIVALGRVRQLPRYAPDGSLQPAAVMAASWGADHRVVDGATLAGFSNLWKALLERPERMLLALK